MNDLHFDPFSVSDSRFIANNEDLDPENNYYNDLSLHDLVYLTADSLCKSIESNSSNFSIIHVNCRSLKKIFDSLTLLLGELCFPGSAICVSETWTVPDSEQVYCIPGYTFYGKSRPGKIGGGVAIDCIVRSDLDLNNDSVESIFIELLSILYLVVSIDPPIPILMVLCDILSLLNSQKTQLHGWIF